METKKKEKNDEDVQKMMQFKISQLIKKNSQVRYLYYDPKILMTNSFDLIKKHFKKECLYIETIGFGIIGLAFPIGFEDGDFEILVNTCPVNCDIAVPEMDYLDGEDEDYIN